MLSVFLSPLSLFNSILSLRNSKNKLQVYFGNNNSLDHINTDYRLVDTLYFEFFCFVLFFIDSILSLSQLV